MAKSSRQAFIYLYTFPHYTTLHYTTLYYTTLQSSILAATSIPNKAGGFVTQPDGEILLASLYLKLSILYSTPQFTLLSSPTLASKSGCHRSVEVVLYMNEHSTANI